MNLFCWNVMVVFIHPNQEKKYRKLRGDDL